MTGKPRRVLVVEDDPEILRNTVELIGDRDVLTDEARNGAEALEALRSGWLRLRGPGPGASGHERW